MTELPKKELPKDTMIAIRINAALASKIRRKAKENRITLSQMVEYGFLKYLEDSEKKTRR